MRQRVSVVIIKDNKLLLVRGIEDYYFTPGGKIEEGETANQAVVRELNEELQIVPETMTEILSYEAPIQGTDELQVVMCFKVDTYIGDLNPSAEIKEIYWYGKDNFADDNPKIAKSMFKYLLPALIEKNLL